MTVETIREAMKHNPLALDAVLTHFDKYITACATIEHMDEAGNIIKIVDAELKGHLQSKLMMALPKFRLEGVKNT